MSDSRGSSDGWSFEEELSALIERAHTNGTDVEGAWKCSIDGNGDYHWDIQITAVRYDD